MMKKNRMQKWGVVVSLAIVVGGSAFDFTNDPTADQYYFGQEKRLSVRVIDEQVFKPEDQQANFTFFNGVQGVEVKDGVFTVCADGTESHPRVGKLRKPASAGEISVNGGQYHRDRL